MANEYLVNSSDMTAVADAIRAKGGTSEALAFPDGFVEAVEAIQAGSGGGLDHVVAAINRTLVGEFYDESLTRTTNYMFEACNGMTKATLVNVESCGEYLFANCKGLEEASLLSVGFVGNYCFSRCTALKKVVAPVAIRLINYCFKDCTALETVDCAPTTALNIMNFSTTTSLKCLIIRTPSVLGMGASGCLDATQIASGSGYVYVPASLVDSYKTATNWSAYADQIRAIEDYPEITGG